MNNIIELNPTEIDSVTGGAISLPSSDPGTTAKPSRPSREQIMKEMQSSMSAPDSMNIQNSMNAQMSYQRPIKL